MGEIRTLEILASEADILWSEYGNRELTVKERRAIPQQDMPTQDPGERRENMTEVALGYTENQVKVEAMRCLQCKNAPCIAGCPVSINIPLFIDHAARGEFKESISVIKESSLLPAICGRVCPQEKQCMLTCTVGKAMKDAEKSVAIGRIERYVSDWEIENNLVAPIPVAENTGRKVAVVGSGPSGLTAAADIRREGHSVTVFEAFHKAGGVTIYGIPEFRLPKEIVEKDVVNLKAMGVRLITNILVGRTRKIEDMLKEDGYDAVYVATGAGLPKFMNIPGENLVGVFSANEYLTRSNLMKAYATDRAATPMYKAKKVCVFGGGNVAMDAARTAVRLGAEEVRIVYRRTEAELPARVEEVHHAMEEGVIFDLLSSPIEILGDDQSRVRAIICQRYELGEPDESGRRRPIAIEGDTFELECDACIPSIGNIPNPLIRQTKPEIKVNKWGNIIVEESTGKTTMDKVYAGGDIVLGAATVILAMGEGRRAAKAINEQLKK